MIHTVCEEALDDERDVAVESSTANSTFRTLKK